MGKKKLKRKIWITAIALFLIYVNILILNPTIWISLLPILIPTGILTVGLPAYAIIKNVKIPLEHENKKQKISIKEQNIENTQNVRTKEKSTENNMPPKKFDPIELETQFKQDRNQEEKPKVKTKGTIH